MVIGLTDDVTTCDHTWVGLLTQLRWVHHGGHDHDHGMVTRNHPLGVGPSRTT